MTGDESWEGAAFFHGKSTAIVAAHHRVAQPRPHANVPVAARGLDRLLQTWPYSLFGVGRGAFSAALPAPGRVTMRT